MEAFGPLRIAVVGSGPRGLAVLERLVARMNEQAPAVPVTVYLVDAVEVGCGRIWQSGQPEWFLMNTPCGEVTMFSGPPDEGRARPGAGPSLAEWWSAHAPGFEGRTGYAPRALHGKYMRWVTDVIEASLPATVRLHRVTAAVEDLEPTSLGYRLDLSTGDHLLVDKVVLTTGHPRLHQVGMFREFEEFAATRPDLRYFAADSAVTMPLDTIPDGSAVGLLGLGLTFYDLMLALTVGRGGRFVEEGDGLRYLASGREPLLAGGSRSGIALSARGINQKPATLKFRPTLFTTENVCRGRVFGEIDFGAHVLPWILGEIEYVYYLTEVRETLGAEAAAEFTAAVVAATGARPPDIRPIALAQGLGHLTPFDFEGLARPFAGRTFASRAEFERALDDHVRADIEHAVRGNYASPLKAALDVLRDTRWVVREITDFGGLTPDTHRDFLTWFSPRSSLLAAGPPLVRIRQAEALRKAGILRLVGPDAEFSVDRGRNAFVLSSPAVAGSRVEVRTLIDARIANPNVYLDSSPLTRALVRRGIWNGFTNGKGDNAFHTGGVAVTRSPFHPLDRHGRPDTDLYVLGVPAEHTRWFTFVGSGRPGPWNEFTRDADAIARHALTAVHAMTSPVPAG
ncbi:FAD/NAD(P)-binding protein [Lentzea sp. NPDC042327]|uniref:FAD/NAD(P)-binding protein n=1 Tax=Lentzea sp. NPDC042327 TaxID=3154801 RepID=UPI0033DB50E4